MNDSTTTRCDQRSPESRCVHRVPTWVVAMVVLQCLTLLIVFAGQPSSHDAVAAEIYQSRSRDNRPQEAALPNAAAQRRDQLTALNKISKQLETTNERLGQISKLLDSGELRVQADAASQ